MEHRSGLVSWQRFLQSFREVCACCHTSLLGASPCTESYWHQDCFSISISPSASSLPHLPVFPRKQAQKPLHSPVQPPDHSLSTLSHPFPWYSYALLETILWPNNSELPICTFSPDRKLVKVFRQTFIQSQRTHPFFSP